MIKKTLWTMFMIVLTCSAGTTADIRRVVTALDASDKAIALFDSRLTLDPGGTGTPSTILWTTDSAPAGLSFKDDSAAKTLPPPPRDAGTGLLRAAVFLLAASSQADSEPHILLQT